MCPLNNVLPYALYKENKFQLLVFPRTGDHVNSENSELSFLRQTVLLPMISTRIDQHANCKLYKDITQGCQKILNYMSLAILWK